MRLIVFLLSLRAVQASVTFPGSLTIPFVVTSWGQYPLLGRGSAVAFTPQPGSGSSWGSAQELLLLSM